MDPLTVGGVGTLLSGIGSLFGSGSSKRIARQNLALQKEAFDWTKQAQQTTWDREDNAVARRVADLKQSGLSPVLAAGSAAESGSPIKVEAPQMDSSYLNRRQEAFNMMTNAFDVMQRVKAMDLQDVTISKTAAEVDLARAQQQRTMVESDRLARMTDPQLEQIRENILTSVARRKHMTTQQAEMISRINALQHNLSYARSINAPVGQDLSYQKVLGRIGGAAYDTARQTMDELGVTDMMRKSAVQHIRGVIQQGSSIFNRAKRYVKRKFKR